MQLSVNTFKHDLLAGRKLIGLWLALADPLCAEICATAGFDWLVIDAEHAPNDLKSILGQAQAIAPYRSTPIVRMPAADVNLIKQTLELGVQTLMLPMIESAEAAEQAARAMRYPPEGVRGVGSGLARSSRWGAYAGYLRAADAEMCCIIQIESRIGLRNLEAIAAVSGVDAIFVGAADLAADMGLLGQADHPEVCAALDDAIARARDAGKPCGVLATNPVDAQRLLDAGAAFAGVGVDATMLARAARELAGRFGRGEA